MVEEIIENSSKAVHLAEQINTTGTLTTLMSVILLAILCGSAWWFSKWIKMSISTMNDIGKATREMAESNRKLVEENQKKDELTQHNMDEFNSIRRIHVEEIKRVTDLACTVDKRLEKVESKQDNLSLDVKEVLTILKSK